MNKNAARENTLRQRRNLRNEVVSRYKRPVTSCMASHVRLPDDYAEQQHMRPPKTAPPRHRSQQHRESGEEVSPHTQEFGESSPRGNEPEFEEGVPNVLPADILELHQSLQKHLTELKRGIAELINEDDEWLDNEYGFSSHLKQVSCYAFKLLKWSSSVYSDLNELNQSTCDMKQRYEEIRSNLDAIEFNGYGDLIKLQDSVCQLENEIRSIEPNRVFEVPEDFLKVNPLQRFIALKFLRQEQLLVLYKKQFAKFQANAPISQTLREFGSVSGLLQSYAQLEDENKRLRLRELRFSHDPLLKRCKLKGQTIEYLSVLCFALQNELSYCHAITQQLNVHNHPLSSLIRVAEFLVQTPNSIDIDSLYKSICGLKNDKDFELFSNINDIHNIPESLFHQDSRNDTRTLTEAQFEMQCKLNAEFSATLVKEKALTFKLSTILMHLMNTNPDVFKHMISAHQINPITLSSSSSQISELHSKINVPSICDDSNTTRINEPAEDDVKDIDEAEDNIWQLDAFCTREEYIQSDTLRALQSHANVLQSIYCMFAEHGEYADSQDEMNGMTTRMTLNEFIDFCKTFSIIPDLISKRILMEIFRIANLLGVYADDDVETLSLNEFKESLIRIALAAYGDDGYMGYYPSQSSRVTLFLNLLSTTRQDLVYHKKRQQMSNEWTMETPIQSDSAHNDENLAESEMSKISPESIHESTQLSTTMTNSDCWYEIEKYAKQLRQVFMSYRKRLVPMGNHLTFDAIASSNQTMNMAEFNLFVKEFGIVPKYVTKRDAAKAFHYANTSTNSDERLFELSYPEFKDAIIRLGMFAVVDDAKQLNDAQRVARFLDMIDLSNMNEFELNEKLRLLVSGQSLDTIQIPLKHRKVPRKDAFLPMIDIKFDIQQMVDEQALEQRLQKLFLFYSRAIDDNRQHGLQPLNTLSLGGVNMFCRDYGIVPSMLKRDQIAALFNQCNRLGIHKDNDIMTFSYPEFIEFIVRVGIHCESQIALNNNDAAAAAAASTTPQLHIIEKFLIRIGISNVPFATFESKMRGQRSGGAHAIITAHSQQHHRSSTPMLNKRRGTTVNLEALRTIVADEACGKRIGAYERMLKEIFDFYAKSQILGSGHRDFSTIQTEMTTLNQAEILKFFKDFKVVPRLVSNEQAIFLFKVVNSGPIRSTAPSVFKYEEFKECLLRLAILAFSKSEYSTEYTNDADKIAALLDYLDLSSQTRSYRSKMKAMSANITTETSKSRTRSKVDRQRETENSKVFTKEVRSIVQQNDALFTQMFKRYCPDIGELLTWTRFSAWAKDYQIVPQRIKIEELKSFLDSVHVSATADRDSSTLSMEEFKIAMVWTAFKCFADGEESPPDLRLTSLIATLNKCNESFAKGASRRV